MTTLTANTQIDLFDFLVHAAPQGGKVRRIDTHAASVFLIADRALKIKRAVRFAFLDFSTLAKRKAACEAEIEVNKPYAPQIYRRVIAITRGSDGTLAIDGTGEPVEYAVEMNRFDETQGLDRLAEAGQLNEGLADKLGRAVVDAHDKAPVVKNANFTAALDEIIGQNDDELGQTHDLFAPDAVKALTFASRAALDRLRPLLKSRERAGTVRRCHGDLHLGNVVLIDEAPVLFDAIEFDPKLATIDVFYDLAFLLMDMIARGLTPLANIVLNRYLGERADDNDLDALALLPLLMSVRAAIRAKVTAARPRRDQLTNQSARDYFTLAQKLLQPPKPILVATGGLSGTGKSLLARALAPEIVPLPGAIHLRSDVIRKNLFGRLETDKLPPDAYTAEVTAKVYAELLARARRVLAAGHSVIADAVFARVDEREAIAQTARSAAIEKATPGAFHGLFLTADLATRIARIGQRANDASDADENVARTQEQYDLGVLDWQKIDASGTPNETLARARRALVP
jgi:aminoglycoside phosphotransferase family enzyme/predicted kinase